MAKRANDRYLDPYRAAVKAHGPGFEATLWNSKAAQILRFDVMIDLAGFDGCAVLDAGCGQGDFAARLLERQVAFQRFIGIDAVPELIETARQRNLPRCVFEVHDVVTEPTALATGHPDYVCISGTLNTMSTKTARKLVRAAFEAAARGVLFNFLSNRPHPRWTKQKTEPAHRFDTVGWLDWALGRSSRVQFTQAYLDGHDGTIMIERSDGATKRRSDEGEASVTKSRSH